MIDIGTKLIPCIDAHTHVFPEINGIRLKTKAHKSEKYGVTSIDGEPVQFLSPAFENSNSPLPVYERIMELCGVDKAVFPQSPAYGRHYDYMDQVLASRPGRYVTTGLAFPWYGKEQFLKDTADALDNHNYRGLKFEMPDTPFQTDDPEYSYVFDAIQQRGKICMIDMGWHQSEWDFPIEMITNTVKMYKDCTFLFPHLGISHLWDIHEYDKFECLSKMLDLMNYNDNVWFDISGLTFMQDWDFYPYPYCKKVLKKVKEEIGFDHVMFGTDYPCLSVRGTYKMALDYVRTDTEVLSDADKENLFYKAANKLWFEMDQE